ncbi:hypothetical protein AYI69_g595 [Smittium culicis]|uniref:Uncharacterized protein n=1 Tax=Smittium culicis TaxID=133412 RepID=A0A1R1YSK3_9FUNG|nr:hypothetical protein AYI69_g595 [Smittium culicis]
MRMSTMTKSNSSLMRSMAADLPTLIIPESCRQRYNLLDIILDRPRYVPFAIHDIAQVSVLVGEVSFFTLWGYIISQFPAYSHYPTLGGIHNHIPSVRPFGYGIQCTNSIPGMREVSTGTRTERTPLKISFMNKSKSIGEIGHHCGTQQKYSGGVGNFISNPDCDFQGIIFGLCWCA